MSYVFQIVKEGYLAHIYWGRRIQHYHDSFDIRYEDRAFSPNPNPEDRTFSLDTLPQEFPSFGNTDFRNPAVRIQMEDGSHISDFRYYNHEILHGKKELRGLPSTYGDTKEVETLIVTLKDTKYPIFVELSYSAFKDKPILVRSTKLINKSNSSIMINKLHSFNVDFRDDDFELIHLAGAWGRERNIIRQAINQGSSVIESRRGSSSHHHNPFIALVRPCTTENYGDVYGFSLVYSGSFLAQIEKNSLNEVRINMGLNPFNFSWKLSCDEEFVTPETVMTYSSNGLGDFSRIQHKFFRLNLIRGKFKETLRPVLINNWEATYFDFDEAKLTALLEKSKQVGIELFVLDDGWFGERNSDKSSLGDWNVNLKKLPNGLSGIEQIIHQSGLKFGLWVEPEMISKNSKLFDLHPDWCLQVEDRRLSESRNQLVLDLTRSEVCEYIYDAMDSLLSSNKIDYIKWDMNRNMTEAYSLTLSHDEKLETEHRYILGLYSILEKLTMKHSNVLFESCSGGGGRFDPGMLYYMPQVWTSDNTDAVCRLNIQYGTSLAYPILTMGSHVSEIPNHQVERSTSLKFRGDVAMSGNFGYELDLTKLRNHEMAEIKKQIKDYKLYRHIIQLGDFYRLKDPFTSNYASWSFISQDTNEVLVYYYLKLAQAQGSFQRLKLVGLDEYRLYRTEDGKFYGGDELMNVGLDIPLKKGDFQSYRFYLRKV